MGHPKEVLSFTGSLPCICEVYMSINLFVFFLLIFVFLITGGLSQELRRLKKLFFLPYKP